MVVVQAAVVYNRGIGSDDVVGNKVSSVRQYVMKVEARSIVVVGSMMMSEVS